MAAPTQSQFAQQRRQPRGNGGNDRIRWQTEAMSQLWWNNSTAIWFKFDVGGEETEAPEVPRLQ
jgi:hypothetical protein